MNRKGGLYHAQQPDRPDQRGDPAGAVLPSLRLRYTPELQFVADDSIAQGAHILEMLRDETVVKPPNPANEHIILDEE